MKYVMPLVKYHLRLIKAKSYTGIVTATAKKPDVYVTDVDTYTAALATGYFKGMGKVEEEPAEAGLIPGHMDPEQLSTMALSDLKKMASDMGVNTAGLKTKAQFAEAIAAVEVYVPEQDDDSEGGSEADFDS